MRDLHPIMQKKVGDVNYIGIILAKDWFPVIHYPTLPSDFVFCRWADFHDGENSHIEGMKTIAICRYKEDAILLYNSINSIKTQIDLIR
jgi:hypothetical protein